MISNTTATIPQLEACDPQSSELANVSKRWERYALYAALIMVMGFFAFVRVRLSNMPLERDEGEYAYAGQLILHGIPPYRFAYNMKLPGTYAAYALIMAVFGETVAGIHLGIMLVNAAATFLVFLLGKYLHGPLVGVVSACTYALLSTRSSVLGLQGHATQFVVLAELAGILLLLHATKTGRRGLLFLSGVALGLAFLMKQPGIIFAIFAVLYWLWIERTGSRRQLAAGSAILLSGVAVPFALTCLILYRAGVFREFWFWTFSYARAYGSILSLRDGWRELCVVGPWVTRPFLIWGIATVGLTAMLWNRKVRRRSVFSLGFLFFSFMAVCPGLYFRPHYFIVLLPAVALWTGIAIAAAQDRLRSESKRWLAYVPLTVFVISFGLSIRGHWNIYFRLDPLAVYAREHDSQGWGCADGCVQAAAAGEYIRARSSESGEIAVLGSEPAIYFYAHRRSATGYIYMFPLTERQEFAHSMQQQMIGEISRNRPEFLVYVDDGYSWQTDKVSPREESFLDRLQQFVRDGYHLEKQFPISSDSWHRWGDHSAMYIFHRND